MFTNQYPHFQKGRILKLEMLENLRDFPREFLDLYFEEYSNGIIAGCHIHVTDTSIILTKGIMKHNKRLYMLHRSYELPYEATGNEMIVKVRFAEEVNHLDFTQFTTTIVLDNSMYLAANEMEIVRFKLKVGAKLRSEPIDFSDYTTEYNTVNYLHCEYAGVQKSTYHPRILQCFAKELLKNRPTNTYDITFALACLNEERVQRDVIEMYISNRLELEFQPFSNSQIHKYLYRILGEAKNGGRGTGASPMPSPGRPKRMIVD
ncbi:DNA and RNA helicase [Lysinibacillus fusiformis]|uniref:DNA and RNA helicase n=1 Tax=Lysinibacillus fusiformis TaxID=28031 RepID=UPI00365793C1